MVLLQGPLQVTTGAYNAIDQAAASLVKTTMDPGSTFGDFKKKVDNAKLHTSQIMLKAQRERQRAISYDHGIEVRAGEEAHEVFSDIPLNPTVSPNELGKKGKGVSAAAAPVLAVINSHAGVYGDETGADPEDGKAPAEAAKKKHDHKRLKRIGKAIGDTAQRVGKDTEKVIDVAGQGVKVAAGVLQILGGTVA